MNEMGIFKEQMTWIANDIGELYINADNEPFKLILKDGTIMDRDDLYYLHELLKEAYKKD